MLLSPNVGHLNPQFEGSESLFQYSQAFILQLKSTPQTERKGTKKNNKADFSYNKGEQVFETSILKYNDQRQLKQKCDKDKSNHIEELW